MTNTSSWTDTRLKNLFTSVRNGVWGDDPDEDTDTFCARGTDFDRIANRISLKKMPRRNIAPSMLRQHQLRKGDLVLEKSGGSMDQPVGSVALFNLSARTVCSNFNARLQLDSYVDPRFACYLMNSLYWSGFTRQFIKQTTGIQNLDADAFLAQHCRLPPLNAQRRIADFLDAETGRLDQLSNARRTQAAKLEELWDARLAAAIDGYARSYGWIPLRRVVTSVEQGWSPQCDDAVAEPDEWAVLKTSAVSSGEFAPLEHKRMPAQLKPETRYQVRDGDILLTRGSGSPELVGMAALARTQGRKLLLSDLLYRVRLQNEWSPEFITLALHSKPVRGLMGLLLRGQSGQTIKLRSEDVRSIEIPAVPIALQGRVATDLAAENQAIRNAKRAIETSLSLLTERRQALITAAVTGEIDVTTAGRAGVG